MLMVGVEYITFFFFISQSNPPKQKWTKICLPLILIDLKFEKNSFRELNYVEKNLNDCCFNTKDIVHKRLTNVYWFW